MIVFSFSSFPPLSISTATDELVPGTDELISCTDELIPESVERLLYRPSHGSNLNALATTDQWILGFPISSGFYRSLDTPVDLLLESSAKFR